MVNDFQQFWDAYGLKRDRIAAQRAWSRLSAKDKESAMRGILPYRESCEQRGIRMMYAQGYINHRRWEDEEETTPNLFKENVAEEVHNESEGIERW